ncbi:FAD-dependent monooxygenase [Gordonia sp. NB41Y]|uniref:FAD-dependent monooxygenase n=1 Tax=Gordonia sp. NB41Y TaxID=875808 RepID=UPI0002BDF161|nr:FAD-dependent monooxygenase [Gordonia sp. NB41Y]WLP90704.1 FAD-dependent monooxygenase [Gordonia sp. NB41Y]
MLAREGVAVDLVEARSRDSATGSGITLQGNALRVLHQLGVWDEVCEFGYGFDTLGIRATDDRGTVLVEMEDVRTGGPDFPATMGMERPELARILRDAAESAGVKMRFSTSMTTFVQDASGVDVDFSDGSHARYDVGIGADGVKSATRRNLGIDLTTEPTGMGIWRVLCSRPASITHTDLYYGGVGYIAGYCPTGPESMYAYIVEDAQDRSALSDAEKLAVMRLLAEHYHGPWDEIRSLMVDPSKINYTWFESHLLDGPWNVGRVVLIGDAAHVCPPTLAQGGALALEDAAVLAELLVSRPVDDDLWRAFHDRRAERARIVVDASLQLGQWMLDHEPDPDVPGLLRSITELVSVPA